MTTAKTNFELKVDPRLRRALRNAEFAQGPAADYIESLTFAMWDKIVENTPVGVSGGGGLRGSSSSRKNSKA